MDLERTLQTSVATYWNPLKRGYTQDIRQAGLYTLKEARQIVEEDIDERTVCIHQSVVTGILK